MKYWYPPTRISQVEADLLDGREKFPKRPDINLQDYKSTSSLKIEAESHTEIFMSYYKASNLNMYLKVLPKR